MHFLGKRQKYRKYYLQRKNYKENVENISMNKSGKIKNREKGLTHFHYSHSKQNKDQKCGKHEEIGKN